ncbi:MAG TPA: hypothetical protein VKQ11_00585 [Candidatus Sulfotelmatobacter sp.]|nr:hypothetical protein [Candidatus Sulfotelmatobacter sp.]
MTPTLLSSDVIHFRLAHAVTAYDMAASRRRGYNRYALGQYLQAVESVDEALRRGKPMREAIVAAFYGRLLDACLKAVGEAQSTREEQR